ncbi:MAG: phosphodiester glycosidase family protein [Desulfovibrionaceae bacterium]|nr:phosphodiester glycosidase family protein [Desulfovibrionaceae bacterium]
MPLFALSFLSCLAGLLLLLVSVSGTSASENSWRELDQGLSLCEFHLDHGTITVVRIDPEYWSFELACAKCEQTQAKAVHEWLKEKNFAAAINASMFKKDSLTSTGYMRAGKSVNNDHISSRFGAFFVANPDKADLASATLLERDSPNLADTLAHYGLVIQNYRLITRNRTVLWPAAGKKHAIAAVALDKDGHILFLYTNTDILPADFARALVDLPLAIGTTMYVEGGSEAALLFREGATVHARCAYFEPILPNVLGIRKKTAQK